MKKQEESTPQNLGTVAPANMGRCPYPRYLHAGADVMVVKAWHKVLLPNAADVVRVADVVCVCVCVCVRARACVRVRIRAILDRWCACAQTAARAT